jgi:monoamine oxidase
MTPAMEMQVEVAIVGAGLAGLSAAHTLSKAGVVSIVVLEELGRVGGRTLNRTLPDGVTVEQGGTWVGPTQRRLLALADELGVAIKNGKPEGRTFYGIGGVWAQVGDGIGDQVARDDFNRALGKFEALAATVDVDAPWRTPDAQRLDTHTIGQWIAENTVTQGGRALFEGCVRKMQGGDPGRVSLLWLLHFVATASFRDLLDTAEDYRFVGGAQGISLALARRLGDRVALSCPVTHVKTDHEVVRLQCGDRRVRARHVILATMPAALTRIRFEPDLPEHHRRLIEGWQPMSWVKFNATYDSPFWRRHVEGRQFLSLDRLVESFDVSPPDEAWGEIVGFLLPDCPGRRAADPEAYALDFLAEVYGPEAREPRCFAMQDWNAEPTVGGCVSSPPPGLLTTTAGALRQPAGRLHFAGTERASSWVNYMEGAVTSGQSAAAEVLGAMRAEGAAHFEDIAQ